MEAKFYFPIPTFDRIGQILTASPQPEFLILKGASGYGKSALFRRLPWALRAKLVVAPILLTGPSLKDILRDALMGFGLGFKCSPQTPEESLLGFFQNAVANFVAHDYGLVLAADEAQTLTEDNISELLHLLNLEPKWRGQTTLLAATRPESSWPGPKGAKALTVDLPAFDLSQTEEYVRFRLKKAGGSKNIFSPEALVYLHQLSQGSPAAINDLGERALLTAWATEKKIITPSCLQKAKISLKQPPINFKEAKKAAGFRLWRPRIKTWPARLTLLSTMILVFTVGWVVWPQADLPVQEVAPKVATPAPIDPPTMTPAAAPSPVAHSPGLGLATTPPILLNLPHNANVLVVDQSLGQARLWLRELRRTGLKAELMAPALNEPGLYLFGRPKSRSSVVFQYPKGPEVPKEVSDKLWRQVENLLPQDVLPLIVADSDLLFRPAPTQVLEILRDKLKAWRAAQEVKFTENLALLYADPFVFFEPGAKPQTINRETFQNALASEARTSGDVEIAMSDPLIALDPRNHNRAWAIFSFRYDSKLRHDLGIRTLIFEKNILGDDWRIKAELWIRENSLES
ncbi:MAG: AAA family ATPase [Deltaproteobacteria bacterium]|nr:AAA family ATPase [Deltaproteobacteria bacterium]